MRIYVTFKDKYTAYDFESNLKSESTPAFIKRRFLQPTKFKKLLKLWISNSLIILLSQKMRILVFRMKGC